MTSETIERLQQFFKKFPFFLLPSTKEEEIKQAEKTLGIQFDKQYTAFLKHFGPSYMGIGLFPLINEKHLGKGTTVINATLSFQDVHGKDLPEELANAYVISDDGAGNPFLMNTAGHLYLYDHDSGEFELFSHSFKEICEKTLQEYSL